MKNCTLDYFENLPKGLGLGFNAFGLLFAGFWAQGLGQGGEGGVVRGANPKPHISKPASVVQASKSGTSVGRFNTCINNSRCHKMSKSGL